MYFEGTDKQINKQVRATRMKKNITSNCTSYSLLYTKHRTARRFLSTHDKNFNVKLIEIRLRATQNLIRVERRLAAN